MADDPYATDPFYRNPPLAPPTTTPTTTPQTTTTTTTYDARFEAYSEAVTRYRQGRMDELEIQALGRLSASPRAAEWNQRLGLPATGIGAAPTSTTLPEPQASTAPEQAPAAPPPAAPVTPPPTAAADPNALPARTFPTAMSERGQEVTSPPGQTPEAALQTLVEALRLPGAAGASGVEALTGSRTAGDWAQTLYDALGTILLARRLPVVGSALALPRALMRLPGMARRLQDLERQAAASRYQARTITRIPPPTEGGPPPGTTIH